MWGFHGLAAVIECCIRPPISVGGPVLVEVCLHVRAVSFLSGRLLLTVRSNACDRGKASRAALFSTFFAGRRQMKKLQDPGLSVPGITLLASTFDTFDTQSTSHNECAPLLQRTPPQTRLDSIPCSPKRDVSSGRSISSNRWVTTDNHFKGKPHRMEDRPTGIHQRPGSDRFLPMRFYRQHINSRPTSAT